MFVPLQAHADAAVDEQRVTVGKGRGGRGRKDACARRLRVPAPSPLRRAVVQPCAELRISNQSRLSRQVRTARFRPPPLGVLVRGRLPRRRNHRHRRFGRRSGWSWPPWASDRENVPRGPRHELPYLRLDVHQSTLCMLTATASEFERSNGARSNPGGPDESHRPPSRRESARRGARCRRTRAGRGRERPDMASGVVPGRMAP